MFLNDFFNLVLICKDIERKYQRTRTIGFFPTVRVVSFTTCIHKSFERFIYKVFTITIFKKIYFRHSNSVCNLVQLEYIWNHLQESV